MDLGGQFKIKYTNRVTYIQLLMILNRFSHFRRLLFLLERVYDRGNELTCGN